MKVTLQTRTVELAEEVRRLLVRVYAHDGAVGNKAFIEIAPMDSLIYVGLWEALLALKEVRARQAAKEVAP